jgi:GDP/UDP-N,N'-diacetylbacillosamine 2-epimerase (hydrolysing)
LKIGVFTGNRADWGLLAPIVKALLKEPNYQVSLWIGGDHWGSGTVDEVRQALPHVPYNALNTLSKVEWEALNALPPAQRNWAVTQTHSQQAAALLQAEPLDLIVVLGDRVETFAVTYTAFYMPCWVLHLGGGDWTEGGCPDDRLRYLLSELAHLHATFSPSSAQRLLQRGEEAWRVRCIGNPSLDVVRDSELLSRDALCAELGLNPQQPIALFTQHPVPAESQEETLAAFKHSLEALHSTPNLQVVATYPNSDGHGQALHTLIENEQAKNYSHWRWVRSLGHQHALSWMQACDVVVGNSSSGLYETAFFKTPSITIGPRQAGRERANNVLSSVYGVEPLQKALQHALYNTAFLQQVKNSVNPFGEGTSGHQLLEWLSNVKWDKKSLVKRL